MVWDLGPGVSGAGFGIWGLGFGVYDTRLSAWGLGIGVYGVGFEMYGVGCMDPKSSCYLMLSSLVLALSAPPPRSCPASESMVQGVGCRVQGPWLRVWGSRKRDLD